MNLYDIVCEIIGYSNPTSTSYNNYIIQVCCVIIVLLIVWFLDCVYRLFFRA